jgi:carbon-monoxide dehydrogenase small subunit
MRINYGSAILFWMPSGGQNRVQKAFLEKFAVQYSYCTLGVAVNCHALVYTYPSATDESIDDWLGSNLCRCMG